MRQKPWPLIILALLHIISPFANILVSGLMEGFGITESFTKAFTSELLWHNKFVILLPILAGLAIYACKKISFFIYILCMIALIYINLYSMNLTTNYNWIINLGVLTLLSVDFALVYYFLAPTVRRIYFDRQIRWWENQPRYSMDHKCSFSADKDLKLQVFSGEILNFSENGLFLKTNHKFEIEEKLKINFTFLEQDFEFQGQTVFNYKAENSGYGIKFIHSKESPKKSKWIVKQLIAHGYKPTRLQQSEEDKFTNWLKKLLTTGEGFI